MKAAAGSIMDNIAEGFERSSRLEFVNFLIISKGSSGEVKSQLHRALDQKYCSKEEFDILYAEYDKLAASIAGFINYLNKSDIKGKNLKIETNRLLISNNKSLIRNLYTAHPLITKNIFCLFTFTCNRIKKAVYIIS
ncbi:MAG: four helix bundle protein [Ginsengibacter sp.]